MGGKWLGHNVHGPPPGLAWLGTGCALAFRRKQMAVRTPSAAQPGHQGVGHSTPASGLLGAMKTKPDRPRPRAYGDGPTVPRGTGLPFPPILRSDLCKGNLLAGPVFATSVFAP